VIRRLIPDTLKARSLMLLAIIFVSSHALSLFIYESNRDKSILLTEAADLAQRIGGIVDLAYSFPAEQRTNILNAAQTQFISTFPDIVPLDNSACQHSVFSAEVEKRIDAAFAHHPDYRVEVCVRGEEGLRDFFNIATRHALDMLVNIQFPDGETTSFHAALPRANSLFGEAILIYLALVTLSALLLAWHLIARLIEPINQLGTAATDIGSNLDATPLPENGPRELRAASKAFNSMQSRLKQLVNGQTEIFAAISHDLKSALTRLQLRAEMLENENERQGMERVVNDMRQMVVSIIEFIRVGNSSEPRRNLNLSYLVEDIAEDLIEEGKAVQHVVEPDITYLCQATQLRRAIVNLIENALKYANNATIELHKNEEAITISVCDNGPGIPEEHLENVLRPFFRVEPSRNDATGGQGLGLSITHGIVQAHGGELVLRNRVEGGLCAEMRLLASRRIATNTKSHY
jgi:signal transduction histidine kinase